MAKSKSSNTKARGGKSGPHEGRTSSSTKTTKNFRSDKKRDFDEDKSRRSRTAPKASYECESGRMSGLNDVSWYTRNPQLAEAAGRIPFPYKPGMVLPGSYADGATIDEQFADLVPIPSIMALDWVPSIGWADQPTDPVNVVAREIFAKVRSVFSGSIEADPADFMMYMLALDSVFTYIGWLKRVYRTVSMYTAENFTLPDGLLTAYGFSPSQIEGLRRNKTKLWQYINELVYNSRQLTCPALMDLFNRHYWMSDNVYTDANSPKAQFYIFNLTGVYQYGLSTTEAPYGMLTLQRIPIAATESQGEAIVDALFEFGRGLMNALTSHDDAFIINGYLQKAYDGVPGFIVADLQQGEYLTPVYSEEVLSQIENSEAVPYFGEYHTIQSGTTAGGANVANCDFIKCNVTQDPASGLVICHPYAYMDGDDKSTMVPSEAYLTSRFDSPTVADVIISTRLKARLKASTSYQGVEITNGIIAGTEIPIMWRMVQSTPLGSANATQFWSTLYVPSVVSGDSLMKTTTGQTPNYNYLKWDIMYPLLQVSNFDWHPLSVVLIQTSDALVKVTNGARNVVIIGDVHNVTTIGNTELINLNRVCLYSEFNAFNQG